MARGMFAVVMRTAVYSPLAMFACMNQDMKSLFGSGSGSGCYIFLLLILVRVFLNGSGTSEPGSLEPQTEDHDTVADGNHARAAGRGGVCVPCALEEGEDADAGCQF